ncbi:major facilitator superfamily transporter [Xylariaceae sp. FL1651]|nr:major facilitator superfamily transporter [Xylariaceae sp. FL1651]
MAARPPVLPNQQFTISAVTLAELEPVDIDVEPPKPSNELSWFKRQFDHASITPAVLEWKYKGQGTPEAPFVVDFLPDDKRNPFLFPAWYKWSITALKAIAVLAVAFVSTAYSAAIGEIVDEFHITSPEIAISGISFFVLGFAIGPIFWAPLGEMYGRQITFFVSYAALTALNAATCGAQNVATLAVLRFLAGAFGSSPLTNSGGVIADMFDAKDRGFAGALFALAPFLGPAIGPIAGGFLGQAAGWRWVEGLMALFTGTLWIAVALYVPETYAPVLLRKRAVALSKITGHTYMSKLEVGRPKKTVGQQFKIAISRPWILLFREPIVALLSLYLAVIYGTLYLMFAAFPIIFEENRNWSAGISGLAYLGIAVGTTIVVICFGFDQVRYRKICEANGGAPVPEARLPLALIGSILLPIGLFTFAWTNGPEIPWIVPIIASGIFGAGLVGVFLSCQNYLIDSYTIYAASVIAGSSILRSLFGAAFPLFTTPMYDALGIHWGSSIPAFLALAFIPFPFLFQKYGARIRAKCKYAAEAQETMAKLRAQQVAQAKGAAAANNDKSGPKMSEKKETV